MQASPQPLIHPCWIPITFLSHPCHPCCIPVIPVTSLSSLSHPCHPHHPCHIPIIPIVPTVACGARGGWCVIIGLCTIHPTSSCLWGWGHMGCHPWGVWWWSTISAPWCLGQRGLGRHQWCGTCQGVRCLPCGYPTPQVSQCHLLPSCT